MTDALALKRELQAAGHYPDSDPRFRAAARHLSDADWLDHYAALYAFHPDDLDTIQARAHTLLAAQPDDPRLLTILGDVLAQRRDWPAAAAAFAQAGPAAAAKRAAAAMYSRLRPTLNATPAIPYAAAFTNLDRAPEREAEMRRQFAASAPPLHRQPGIEGSRLAAAAIRRLGADPLMRGTLGCFLSHAAAWENMLARGDAACLFLEDDVIPLLDLPPSLAALSLPPGFELVFVNHRLAPPRDPATVHRFTTLSLRDAMIAFHPEDNAPGADGYLLSQAGAHKLLAWTEADGFADDVDWRLVAYGLTPADIAALPRPSHAGPWLERIAGSIPRPDRLSAHVLHPPLIRSVGIDSERENENRRRPGELPTGDAP